MFEDNVEKETVHTLCGLYVDFKTHLCRFEKHLLKHEFVNVGRLLAPAEFRY